MKKNSILKLPILIGILLFLGTDLNADNLSTNNAKARYIGQTVSSGNWNDAAVWSKTTYPNPTVDKCELTIYHQIIYFPVTNPWVWSSNNNLVIKSGASLTIYGDVNFDANFNITIETGGKLIVYGDLKFNNNVGGIIDGEVYVTGDIEVDGGNSSLIDGNGSIIVDGIITDDRDAIDFSLINGIHRWLIVDKGPWDQNTSWSYKADGPIAVSPPNAQCIVHIPSDFTGIVNLNSSVSGLDLQCNGNLIINPAITLSVFNTVSNQGQITIKSSILGTGGMIYNGADLVSVKYEKYISAYTYNYISSPMTAAPISSYNITSTGYTNPNFYYYDETEANSDWMFGWKRPTEGNLIPGKGYALYSFENYSPILSGGNLINQTFNVPVTNTLSAGGGKSWNLIANPFPCHIDADKLIDYNDQTNVFTGALYFWDDSGISGEYTTSDYLVYTLGGGTTGGSGRVFNGKIAPLSSFFVQADIGGDLIFPVSIKTTETELYTKQSKKLTANSNTDDLKIIRVSVSSTNGLYNDILLKFADDASEDIDIYDGRKLKGNPNIAFYSFLNGEEFAIQSFPNSVDNLKINLGLDATIEGTYIIKVEDFKNIDDKTELYLEDRYIDRTIDLRNSDYTFTSSGISIDRFVIHFGKNSNASNIKNLFDPSETQIYTFSNKVIINNVTERSHAEIFDITGKLVSFENVEIGNNTFIPNLKPGYYIIKVSNNNQSISNKIYIQ